MEIDALNSELLADFGTDAVPGLRAFIGQGASHDLIQEKLFQAHEELLTQQLVFAERYLDEKAQRYRVREPIFESNDPGLIIDVGNMQYFSK